MPAWSVGLPTALVRLRFASRANSLAPGNPSLPAGTPQRRGRHARLVGRVADYARSAPLRSASQLTRSGQPLPPGGHASPSCCASWPGEDDRGLPATRLWLGGASRETTEVESPVQLGGRRRRGPCDATCWRSKQGDHGSREPGPGTTWADVGRPGPGGAMPKGRFGQPRHPNVPIQYDLRPPERRPT